MPERTAKACTRCGETKPLEEFNRDASHGDGRRSACRACAKAARPAYFEANREKELARNRAWRAANGERRRAASRAYCAANREKELARYRAYHEANREKRRAKNRAWREANPEKARAWQANHPAARASNDRRRRARLAAVEVNDLTATEWAAILATAGGRCAYCGKRRKLTMDHVIPISRGGDHTASNVVPACKSCNSSKCDGPVRPYQTFLL